MQVNSYWVWWCPAHYLLGDEILLIYNKLGHYKLLSLATLWAYNHLEDGNKWMVTICTLSLEDEILLICYNLGVTD